MAFPDQILEKKYLKKQLYVWRVLAIILIATLMLTLLSRQVGKNFEKGYIVRIAIEGEIFENPYREERLLQIAKDPKVKAVIVHVNSPGGTPYGGESLYNAISEIRKQKPVVTVMGTLATSAGYMVSVAADHIVARGSTITASIGAIFIHTDISRLAKLLGVRVSVFRKGKSKAAPFLFDRDVSEDAKQIINSVLEDQYNLFFDIVLARRNIQKADLDRIADSRIVTGVQALKYKLIDQLGAEKEALEWLSTKRNVNVDKYGVRDINIDRMAGIGNIFSLHKIRTVVDGVKTLLKAVDFHMLLGNNT